MAEVPFHHVNTFQDQTADATTASRRKQSQPQRQILSCTKCRERKVKCDRTKPCSACCARGLPRDCHFIAEDGNYTPIQQSYELRKLRAENLQLKERFRALSIPIQDEESDPGTTLDSQLDNGIGSARKRRAVKQKRLQGSTAQDSIYFGSPAIATVINEFAIVNADSPATLAHLLPRQIDMFTSEDSPTYVFATLFSASPDECIPQLLSCLPAKCELSGYLNIFDNLVSTQMPATLSRIEIERFLSDVKSNSQSCPTMLALLLTVVALGAQHSVCSNRGECDPAKVKVDAQKGNVYIAAAFQALRLASFLHKPSLLAIQVLILIGKHLTNSGRFLDAFTLFGMTVRMAYSIGLHCHPRYLEPPPPTQAELATRQKIWWYMLRLDEEYSMTFGRPLGISSIGTCCWPQELTTDPIVRRFGEFMAQFTVLARQILSSNRLTDIRIDEFTDALRRLLDTMPETLQFTAAWKHPENTPPHELWPLMTMAAVFYCKAHTYLILLNRQRTQNRTSDTLPGYQDVDPPTSNNSSPTMSARSRIRGRAVVVTSSEEVLSVFEFLYCKQRSALIDWSVGQQAFNSSMLLMFDAIERQRFTHGASKVEQSLLIFRELGDNNLHRLARYAAEKIGWCLKTLHEIVAQSPHNKSEAHSQQHERTVIQGSGQSEATRALAAVETVMGHNGMQLLEDCGMQSSAPEAFAPMNWNTSGLLTGHAKEHGIQQEDTHTGQKNTFDPGPHGQGTRNFQSTDAVQGLSRSVARYATAFHDDLMQPHGYTGSASPRDLAELSEQRFNIRTTHDQERQAVSCHETVRRLDPKDLFQEADEAEYWETFNHGSWRHDMPPTASETREPYANPLVAVTGSSYGTTTPQRHYSYPVPLRTNVDHTQRPAYFTFSNTNELATDPAASTPLHTSVATPLVSEANTSHGYFPANLTCPPRMDGNSAYINPIGRHAPCSSIPISSANPTDLADSRMFHRNQGQLDSLY